MASLREVKKNNRIKGVHTFDINFFKFIVSSFADYTDVKVLKPQLQIKTQKRSKSYPMCWNRWNTLCFCLPGPNSYFVVASVLAKLQGVFHISTSAWPWVFKLDYHQLLSKSPLIFEPLIFADQRNFILHTLIFAHRIHFAPFWFP